MSAEALPAFPASQRPVIQTPARRLAPVAAPLPRRRPRLLYGLVAVGGAVAIGAAQMGLSIMTTQGSYEIASLTAAQRDVSYQQQILQDDIAGLSSPQYLAANATALGMVINEAPNYLRLSDGATIGKGHAAGAVSSVDALDKAAVPNHLVNGVPLVTDPEASLESGKPVQDKAILNTPTPPPITDGLPTPTTH